MRPTFALSILAFMAFASCSDNESQVLQPISEKTYSGSQLDLFYNGELMPNKSVTVTQSGDKATATLFSEFDLSQLSAFGLSGSIPAPGVLPGEVTTQLTLDMKHSDKFWNFSGTGSNAACTYNYKGNVNAEKMTLYLSDVKLNGPSLNPAVWTPAPIKEVDGAYTSLPFFINWQYDPLPDIDIDLTPYLEALTTLPVIPVYNNTAYMSVSQALSLLLKTVAFRNDGNLIVSYISSVGGASRLAQTLPNRFMYVPVAANEVNLYLNPTALFGMLLVATSPGTPAEDVKIVGDGIFPSGHTTPVTSGFMQIILKSEIGSKMAKSALSVILPRLADGLPFNLKEADGQLHICLDNQIAMDLLEQIVTPVLADSEAVKAIEAYIEGSANLKPLLPLLSQALQLLPAAIEKTNQFEIGLAFVPYTN